MAEAKVPGGGRCPLCGKPRHPDYRPFCSARCRDRDLIKWMQGDYRIPEVETEPDDDEEPPERA